MKDNISPIFVGGTGRSGTTIMGKYLNSHKTLTTPVHENKLIVEDKGLRSLVDNLSEGYDYKGNHYAIESFIRWASILRRSGFRNQFAGFLYRGTNRMCDSILGRRIPAEKVCRAIFFFKFSYYAIGQNYGLAHYDKCINQFLSEIIGETDARGIVDTEGLIRPVYSPRTLNRDELLNYCRNLLNQLNEPKLTTAAAQRWLDDTPLNARYADFLLELYPTGKVVHMVRDPRDVAASYAEQSWSSSDIELLLIRLKRQYLELIKAEERMPEQSFRTLRLEDFVLEPKAQKEKLCEFLRLDSDGFDGSVSFEGSSFGRWRKKFPSNVAEIVERELGDACAHFGYDS